MSSKIVIHNATEVFRREPHFYEFLGFSFWKPIPKTPALYAMILLFPLWFLYAALGALLTHFNMLICALPGFLFGIITAWLIAKYFGTPKEVFDGLNLHQHIIARYKWKRQARGYLDGYEYNPNQKRIYRIDAMIQISRRAEEAQEQEQTQLKKTTSALKKRKKSNTPEGK